MTGPWRDDLPRDVSRDVIKSRLIIRFLLGFVSLSLLAMIVKHGNFSEKHAKVTRKTIKYRGISEMLTNVTAIKSVISRKIMSDHGDVIWVPP